MRKKPPRKMPKMIEEELSLAHHTRKMQYLKARRNLRKLEISLARFRVLAKFAVMIFLIWALCHIVNMPEWYLDDYVFNIYPNNNLEIEGNEIVSHQQVIKQLSGIRLPHKPIYLLNTKSIESALLKLTPIKKVYIRRFWFPAKLRIVIDEKRPILSILPSPKVKSIAVFTEDISIIDREFLPLHYSKPVFSIITYDDYTKWTSKQVKYLDVLSKLIEKVTNKKLEYLDIRNPDDVYAQLDNIKLRLGELDRTCFARTERVSVVLSEALKMKDSIDYVDLRWNKSIAIKLKNKDMPKGITDKEPGNKADKTKAKDEKPRVKDTTPKPQPKPTQN